MLCEIGLFALILALGCSLLQTLNSSLFITKKNHHNFLYTKYFLLIAWFFTVLAFLSLVLCFVFDDFSVNYVALNSNSKLNIWYKACAIWGGHEGSILLWVFILQCWSVAVLLFAKELPDNIINSMLGVLGLISCLLFVFIIFTSNPFASTLNDIPIDGLDLNPLLQDIGFVSHPPILYLGYVGTALPFAFAMALLINNQFNSSWLAVIRPFALVSFACLTLGIVLGSWWAYYELGWGGWWFWDPVENASFMPWLTMVGFIHVQMLTKKNSQFFAWLILLAIISFILSLLGTFLVRSGVITSVHSFVSDPIRGNYILSFLAFVIGVSLLAFLSRAPKNISSAKFNIFSREIFLLTNSAIFVVIAAIVLLGTMYPLFVEMVYNKKISVGAPYFNSVTVPVFLAALPLIVPSLQSRWGINSALSINKTLCISIISISLSYCLLYFFTTNLSMAATIGVAVGLFIILGTLLAKNTFNNIFMLIAHCGIGVSIIGISIVSSYSIEKNFDIKLGSSVNMGEYNFKFSNLELIDGPNYISHKAEFIITKNNKAIAKLNPEKRFFLAQDSHMTETALLPGLFRDLYLAMGDHYSDNTWSFKIYFKPFVRWIWFGGIFIALGSALVLIPFKVRRSAREHFINMLPSF